MQHTRPECAYDDYHGAYDDYHGAAHNYDDHHDRSAHDHNDRTTYPRGYYMRDRHGCYTIPTIRMLRMLDYIIHT